MGKLVDAVREELTQETAQEPAPVERTEEPITAVQKATVTQRGEFWRRRPSVNLKVAFPDVKMQGVIKNTVVKLKGVAYNQKVGFEHRTCANPITITNVQMQAMQTAVDNKLAELAASEKLSSVQVGYINGHMTNHFNDYVVVED